MRRSKNDTNNKRASKSMDGMLPGASRGAKKVDDFDKPFMNRQRRFASKNVAIGDKYSPKQLIKNGMSSKNQVAPSWSEGDNKDQNDKEQLLKNKKNKRSNELSSRKNKKAKKPKKRHLLRNLILLILVILVAFGGYIGLKGYSKLRNIFRGGGNSAVVCGEVGPDKLKVEGDGRVNILILGIGGTEQPNGPNLTDTIMVASLNPVDDTVKLLSLPRDLWVSVDGVKRKINEAYQTGLYDYQKSYSDSIVTSDWRAIESGFKLMDKTIKDSLGLNIDFNVVVSYKGFVDAIDAVGGIEVDAPSELRDYSMAWENKGNPVLAVEGKQDMNGRDALMYARSRHGSARGDFDRAERQRIVLSALQDKVLSAGTLANPLKINSLLDAVGNNVRTDIDGEARTCLINRVKKMNSKMESLDLYDLVKGSSSPKGSSIQIPKAGLNNFNDIKSFLGNNLKDGYISKENTKIMVVGVTGFENKAKSVIDELKSYGYNVVGSDKTTNTSANGISLIDLSNGQDSEYTLNYLKRRFMTSVSHDLPTDVVTSDAKIVIIAK